MAAIIAVIAGSACFGTYLVILCVLVFVWALRVGRQSVISAVALLTVAACGTARPATAGPASTPTPTAVAADASLHCRLPIGGYIAPAPKGGSDNSSGSDGYPNQKGVGGFLDLPGGTYTPASDSDRTYLAGAKAWVPAVAWAVAPDQKSFALTKGMNPANPASPTVYIVDVATRRERVIYSPPPGQAAVIVGFTMDGVYVFTPATQPGPGSFGFVLVDPVTGSSRTVAGSPAKPGTSQMVWAAVSGDAAWGAAVSGEASSPKISLVRLGLKDGTQVDWYDSPGYPLIAGFDAQGHPIIGSLGQADSSLSLISAPQRATKIQATGGVFSMGRPSSIVDAHGTWFGSGDGGIWLYRSDGILAKVGSVPPQAGGSGQPLDPHSARSIAGPCLS